MTNKLRELTTPDSWDAMWATWRPPAHSSRLRRRIRKQREWEHLLHDLLNVGGKDVLELGCAPGAMLTLLHSLCPNMEYRGIDYAPLGIDIARRQLASAGIPAELAVADIKTAELKPADIVVSFGLIEHFDDPAQALSYHRRFTAPGGHTAVTVPNYAHPLVEKVLAKFSPETLATHNLAIMSPAAMRRAFEAAGFTNVRTGYAGTASLPSSRVRKGFGGQAFRKFARAWNLATEIMPAGWPWANHVWGVGLNPRG